MITPTNYRVVKQLDGTWYYQYMEQDGYVQGDCKSRADGIRILRRLHSHNIKITVGKEYERTVLDCNWTEQVEREPLDSRRNE